MAKSKLIRIPLLSIMLSISSLQVSCALLNHMSFDNPPRVPFMGFGHAQPTAASSDFPSPYLRHPEDSPVQLEMLQTGRLSVPIEGMLNPDSPKTKELLKSGPYMDVEVFVHVIQHTTFGSVLIDTGLDASFRDGPGNIHGIFASNYIHKSYLGAGESIGEQLAARKIHPKAVIYTHLHGDHTAGTPEIDKSIRFIAGKNEVYHNIPIFYHSEHLKGIKQLEEIDPDKCPLKPMIGKACDVFGDQSVFAISTPGHSEGHLSYLVFSKDGPVLIAGDASHTRFGFENNIEPGWADDRDQAKASLLRLKELSTKIPGIKMIFGHKI